jgi:MerR family transcriptional regulator/heat shock protein HspR
MAEKESKEKKMPDEELHRPRYPISVVADMLGVHPQTLRMYEREGLVKPQRTARQTRMYSESDLEQLRSIISLTEIGVNLAGVEIILRMRNQIEKERERFQRILTEIWERYKIDVKHWEEEQPTDLIPIRERKVVRIKKEEDKDEEKDKGETIDAE